MGWAVHYWEHSNWPRTNILSKFYDFLSLKNIVNSINICGIFRNNEKYLHTYLLPKLEKLEKIYTNIKFYYYFYQNDSIDNTHIVLDNFIKNKNGNYLSENNISYEVFKRDTSFDRIKNICNCRNKLLNMRPFEGEWTIMIDSDIYFDNNLIERFISKKIPDDLIALTVNGRDNMKCKNHNNCNHFYDTLSLVFSDNISGFSYYLETGFKCCPFKNESDINNWNNNNLIKVNSSFGGLSIYRTSILNNKIIKYTLECHPNTNHFSEHIGFNNILRNFGNIYVDPTITVTNREST